MIESDTFINRRNKVETNLSVAYSSSVLSPMCRSTLYPRQDLWKHREMYNKFQAIEKNWYK